MKRKMEDGKFWDFHQVDNRKQFIPAHARYKRLANLAQKFAKKGEILDVGIGDGYLLELLYTKGFSCWGVDIAKKSLIVTKKLFKEKQLDIKLIPGNITKLEFPSGKFSLVVASEIIEHFDEEMIKKSLKEVNRCLKNGGYFIITVPAEEDLTANVCYCPHCNNTFHRFDHKTSFNKRQLLDTIKTYGFSIISIDRIVNWGLERGMLGMTIVALFRPLLIWLNRKHKRTMTETFFVVARKDH